MQNKNPNSLFGADINEYKENVNFDTLSRTVDFLYLRASGSASGKFRIDQKFIAFAKGSRQYKIPVGAYHYSVPSADLSTADSQCDGFISALQQGFGTGDYGDLFPVLDVEAPTNKSISTEQLLNWVNRFKRRFETKTRRKLMLYTGTFFIQLYDDFFIPGRGHILKDMPLWIAMYVEIPGNPPYPPNIGGWTRWRIWQYTEKGSVNGVDPPVDLNWGPNNIDYLRPPVNVRNFKATADRANIYTSWSQNPDVDLSGYNLFVNGNYITTLNRKATSYIISKSKHGLSSSTPLEVCIEAFDFDGDFSKKRTCAVVPKLRGDNNEIDETEYTSPIA